MRIEMLKSLDFSRLKDVYTDWLNNQGLSIGTINTAKADAFYILKYNPDFDYWGMIESDDFEDIARDIVMRTLAEHSKD